MVRPSVEMAEVTARKAVELCRFRGITMPRMETAEEVKEMVVAVAVEATKSRAAAEERITAVVVEVG